MTQLPFYERPHSYDWSQCIIAFYNSYMLFRLENSAKHAAATATQCIAASQGAGQHNTSNNSQDELMDSCKV